jgi:hypothetical protein
MEEAPLPDDIPLPEEPPTERFFSAEEAPPLPEEPPTEQPSSAEEAPPFPAEPLTEQPFSAEEVPPFPAEPLTERAFPVETASPFPETPSFQEPSAAPVTGTASEKTPIPDGPLQTDVQTALFREITAHDKPLLGNLNSAKAVRRGEKLIFYSDNVMLEQNAARTVLGVPLTPVFGTQEELQFSLSSQEAQTKDVSEKDIFGNEIALTNAQDTQQTGTQDLQYTEEHDPQQTEEAQAGNGRKPEKTRPQETKQQEEDPLLSFLDRVEELGVDLTIEE